MTGTPGGPRVAIVTVSYNSDDVPRRLPGLDRRRERPTRRGGRRRQRLRERDAPREAPPRPPAPVSWRSARTSATAARSTGPSRRSTPTSVGAGVEPGRRAGTGTPSTGCSTAARGGPDDRCRRSEDARAGRRRATRRPGRPVAPHRDSATRVFANVWQGNPWTKRYRQDGDHPLGATRVAVRRLRARPPVRVRPARRLRRGVLHVLRGRRPRAWRIGGSAWTQRVRASADGDPRRAARRRSGSSERMRRAHHESAYRFLAQKYSAWWLWPLRVALRVGTGGPCPRRPTPADSPERT